MTQETKSMEMLMSLLKEGKQTYYDLNANERINFIIEAPLSIVDDGPCLKTSFKYNAPDSSVVIATKEEIVDFDRDNWAFDNVVEP